jgi:3D-(3,5/4)-trihydroxycyclohexane-1,2-dione acylhydrolase (decyclizing)
LGRLIDELKRRNGHKAAATSAWFTACSQKKQEWEAYKAERYQTPRLYDDVWKQEVLTQPAAIKAALDWARTNEAIAFFDAGDVQANGFQIVEDEAPGRTFTETGASYMGFAVSSVLSTALSKKPFYALAMTGDGSFTMNPQILIDGVQHGAQGCILLFDNRRMAAISGLQMAQYEHDYASNDHVEVDYAAWARAIKGVAVFDGGRSTDELRRALDQARAYRGLSLIHLPVYYGADPLGGLGAFGRWNVGNWCDDVQTLRHEIGL